MFGDIGERKVALAFLRAATASGQQPRELAIGVAVGSQQHHASRIARGNLRTNQQLQPALLGRRVGPHHAGQAVAIGNGERLVAKLGRAGDQFVGMRRPFEKRKIREAVQFGVTKPGMHRPPGHLLDLRRGAFRKKRWIGHV